MNIIKRFIVLFLLVIFISSNCGRSSDSPMQIHNTPQSVTLRPTSTALIHTPTLISTNTATPNPTLLPSEVEAKTLELLQDNGGCFLPCFWGFVPDKDDGDFLTFLAEIGNEDGSITIIRDDLFLNIQTAIAGDSNAVYTKVYYESVSGRKIVYNSPSYNEYFQYYSLHNLLTIYGPPDQVFIVLDTGIAEMGLGVDLYLLSVEYPKDGWMAVFEMPLQSTDGVFRGCPSEALVNLRTWLPENKPQGAFIGGFGGNDKSYLFTIEEATSLTIDEFYQKFKSPTAGCLETSADIHK